AGAALTAFELIGERPYQFTLRHAAGVSRLLADDWPWYVLMEISSGRSAEDARGLIEDILSAALEEKIIDEAVIASSLAQQEAFWHFREVLPESQKAEGASIKHDISVPIASIPVFIDKAARAVESVSPGARPVRAGHVSDGNLNSSVSSPEDGDDAACLALYRPLHMAVHDGVRSLNGSFSAEHVLWQPNRDELFA